MLSPTQLFCVHKRLRIPNSDAGLFVADLIFYCKLQNLTSPDDFRSYYVYA